MHNCRSWTLIVVILSRLAASAVRFAAQEKSDTATIGVLEMKWTESYRQRQRNIDILSSLLAEDFVIPIKDGSTYRKAGYISHSADSSVPVQVNCQT